MNLLDMKPQESTLKLTGFKKKFILNPITLADEVWMEQQYGMERIAEIFSNIEVNEIARIVYKLIRIEDKKVFEKKEVTFMTEDGEVYEKELGGLELFLNMISGGGDKIALVNALGDNLGISRPEKVKKKIAKKAKKVAKKKKR